MSISAREKAQPSETRDSFKSCAPIAQKLELELEKKYRIRKKKKWGFCSLRRRTRAAAKRAVNFKKHCKTSRNNNNNFRNTLREAVF